MQRPNLRRTPLSIATQRQTVRRTLLSSALVASVLLGSAATQAAPVALNIPAQSLANALNELGTQANLQILYSADQVQGDQIACRVRLTLEPVKAWKPCYKAAACPTSSTVIPSSSAHHKARAGAGGYYHLRSRNRQFPDHRRHRFLHNGRHQQFTKLPLSIREAPQTVTVVTRGTWMTRAHKALAMCCATRRAFDQGV